MSIKKRLNRKTYINKINKILSQYDNLKIIQHNYKAYYFNIGILPDKYFELNEHNIKIRDFITMELYSCENICKKCDARISWNRVVNDCLIGTRGYEEHFGDGYGFLDKEDNCCSKEINWYDRVRYTTEAVCIYCNKFHSIPQKYSFKNQDDLLNALPLMINKTYDKNYDKRLGEQNILKKFENEKVCSKYICPHSWNWIFE